MVTKFTKYFLCVLVLAAFPLSGCRNDIFGIFGTTDLDIRWKARNTFRFLSPADLNVSLGDAYSFIVITDTHIENSNAHGLEKLKNAMDGDVKFVVFNGDITQNGERKDLNKFIEIARTLGVPCYPVLGNHDIFFGNWSVWEDLIGSTCYRVNGGDTTLLILDSANDYFGVTQLDWLKRELGTAANRVFIFTHANLFLENTVDIDQATDTRERSKVLSLLKNRCDAMFMGHVHQRMVREVGGVRYITIEDFRKNSVYCQVWVSKNNIWWEFKKL